LTEAMPLRDDRQYAPRTENKDREKHS